MKHQHVQTDPLLLPRVREAGRLDRMNEFLGWGSDRGGFPDVTFPDRLLVWGAELPLFQSTLGDEIASSDQRDANVVILSRRKLVPSRLGYYLETVADNVPRARISSKSIEGARAGLQTLAQLFRQFGRTLPSVQIRDWPAFPTRGVMLDVSRCRIPTMPEFRRIIPLLASLKFNHLQLYTEHTFAYRDHKAVWEGWDPITADEIRELSALGALHGITLAANQNTFGHMKHWLDHPRYAGLAETHDDFDFYGMTRRGPFSLCPTDPAARAFACGLLDELVPNFVSDQPRAPAPGSDPNPLREEGVTRTFVNIGCDETADVGAGRSRDAVARLGKPAVYADHVGAIMRHCLDRGWTPQFWADIALAHAEVLDMLPREAIPLAWGYEPDSPFEQWGRTLAASGREWWVCPGTSSWRSITGRTAERKANIEAAARAGVTHGASGFMVCDWGDIGHTQQWPVTLNALAQAADAAWTGGRGGYDPRAASLHAFGDISLTVAAELDELGDLDVPVRRHARTPSPGTPALLNASGLFTVLWPARPELSDPTRLAGVEEWQAIRERLNHWASRPTLPRGQGQTPGQTLLEDELRFTADFASLAASIALDSFGPGHNRSDLVRAARATQREFERLWIARSRSAGLVQVSRFWDELCDRLGGG